MIEITAQNLESFILAWPGLGLTLILARPGLARFELAKLWSNQSPVKKVIRGKKLGPYPARGKNVQLAHAYVMDRQYAMECELKEFTDDDKNQEDYVLDVRFTECLRMNLTQIP